MLQKLMNIYFQKKRIFIFCDAREKNLSALIFSTFTYISS